MNLLGNSLKYTARCFVNANVRQADAEEGKGKSGSSLGSNNVEIIVTDSGRGISADYLQHHLFTPFAQEDSLSPGTGLGAIPNPTADGLMSAGLDEFQARVAELGSLRIRLRGFPAGHGDGRVGDSSDRVLGEGVLIGNVCKKWLHIHLVDDPSEEQLLPNLVLSIDRHINQLLRDRRDGGISVPVVVICRNALLARQLATSPRFTSKSVVFEFVSQPIGSRKLAKVFLLSLRRWTKLQADAIPTPTAMSPANMSMAAGGAGAEANGRSPAGPVLASSPDASSAETFPDVRDDRSPSPDAHPNEASPSSAEEQRHDTDEPAVLPERPRTALASTPKTAERPSPKPRRPPALRFLLVDDNPLNLKILAFQALDAFRRGAGRIACVLMDISMPVMDGFESTRRIRAVES
ncbi:hsp90-like protein [Colletotrichum sojae]|uniref:histidine kinase n=1 Tax=Colletotrichum sojae TaxID=2175907 RepID=A0A8H6MTS6_9PEZI|nr:hsp90-like protein [Colletotrichum sojae]